MPCSREHLEDGREGTPPSESSGLRESAACVPHPDCRARQFAAAGVGQRAVAVKDNYRGCIINFKAASFPRGVGHSTASMIG